VSAERRDSKQPITGWPDRVKRKLTPAEAAAREINELWLKGLDYCTVGLANCPDNNQVAEVIARHMAAKRKKPAGAKGE
jgi:hypothetical protein